MRPNNQNRLFEYCTAGPVINSITEAVVQRHKKENPMSNLKHLNINLEVGQQIIVGQNNEQAKITKIEYFDKTGEISINTTRGPRKALTFKLCDRSSNNSQHGNPADKYR